MGRLFKRLLLFFSLLALLAGGAAALFWNQYQQFLAKPLDLPAEGLVLEVPPGQSLVQLANELESRGIISNARLLRFHVRLDKEAGAIKAGEYRLEPGITPAQLLALLVSGKTLTHSITFPEGWTFRQWRNLIARQPALVHTIDELSDQEVMERIGRPGVHPEGRFFPDTYLFPRGFSDVQLLQRAWKRMETELAAAWKERDEGLPLKTPYEALILASIIEKETGVAGERRKIAGVFIRRLKRGMKLQTDPTVIYGMGEAYQGNIRRKDLKKDTPYNTYVHAGLPPTPICMPGRESLLAAVHPAEGKALYFVAKGDGSHHFSATLREHNRAVRKYQLKRK